VIAAKTFFWRKLLSGVIDETLNKAHRSFPSPPFLLARDVRGKTEPTYICFAPLKTERYSHHHRDREGQSCAQHLLPLRDRSTFGSRPGEPEFVIEVDGKGDGHLGWLGEGCVGFLEGGPLVPSCKLLHILRGLTTSRIQARVFNYGERLIDRLDFEELALKSLDPSLGPRITSPRTVGKDVEQPHVYLSIFRRVVLQLISPKPQIPLIYPQHVITSPLLNLQTLVDKRAPRHKRGAWLWLLASPLTAPFMLIRMSLFCHTLLNCKRGDLQP
jgi:hypothetical protein